MRFCEYFENYRAEKGYSYIDIARKTTLNVKTVCSHCHGTSFPRFETFTEYIRCGILDYADIIEMVSLGCAYETIYDAIPDLYYYFKREEHIYQSKTEIDRVYLKKVIEEVMTRFRGTEQ